MSIDQALTPLSGTPPDKDIQTQLEFDVSAGNFAEWLGTKLHPQLITWTSQANGLASEVNGYAAAAAQSVVDAAEQVSLAADQVDLAEDQVALAVAAKTAAETARDLSRVYSESSATLAEGTINDSVASTEMTYSSSKLESDFQKVLARISYDDRANLRTTIGSEGNLCIVESLGLFRFFETSTEPDDDESCFDTGSGKWLLELPSWDLVDAWTYPDEDLQSSDIEDLQNKIIYGVATCSITSIATLSSVSFTGTISGAEIGDRVIVSPPSQLGATAADTARLSFYAVVTAADTVTIYVCNASASTATTSTAVQTDWSIAVVKEI